MPLEGKAQALVQALADKQLSKVIELRAQLAGAEATLMVLQMELGQSPGQLSTHPTPEAKLRAAEAEQSLQERSQELSQEQVRRAKLEQELQELRASEVELRSRIQVMEGDNALLKRSYREAREQLEQAGAELEETRAQLAAQAQLQALEAEHPDLADAHDDLALTPEEEEEAAAAAPADRPYPARLQEAIARSRAVCAELDARPPREELTVEMDVPEEAAPPVRQPYAPAHMPPPAAPAPRRNGQSRRLQQQEAHRG